MENTHKRPRINKHTDYGMNADMPLDVFAKLCVTEVKKLRVEVGVLHAEITEKDDKIAVLEQQVRNLQKILSDKANKHRAMELEAVRQVKSEKMYNQLKENNRRLKQQIDRMNLQINDYIRTISRNQDKQQNHD